MSNLEQETRPILLPLLRHQPCRLGAASQRTLAAWALKTCLVFQATQAGVPLAPRSHFHRVRAGESLPSQVSVWLTSHYRARFDPINSVYLQRPLSVEYEGPAADAVDFGYLNFLAIGWVGFVVVGHKSRAPRRVIYDGSLADALVSIWPSSSPAFWPPQLMMDRELVELLASPDEGLSLAS